MSSERDTRWAGFPIELGFRAEANASGPKPTVDWKTSPLSGERYDAMFNGGRLHQGQGWKKFSGRALVV
jgi:hypothetical protein